jgi:hypothetical protein
MRGSDYMARIVMINAIHRRDEVITSQQMLTTLQSAHRVYW